MRYEGRTAAHRGTLIVPSRSRAKTPTSGRVTELNGVGVLAYRRRNTRTCALFGAAGNVRAAGSAALPSATENIFAQVERAKTSCLVGIHRNGPCGIRVCASTGGERRTSSLRACGFDRVLLCNAANTTEARLCSAPSDERPLGSQMVTGSGLRTRRCRGGCNKNCWRTWPGKRARISRKTDV